MSENSILYESKHIDWNIQNFFEQPTEVEYKLESSCVSLSDATWFLRIWTNGEERNNSVGYISLYLRRNKSISEHHVICRTGIKNIDGSEFLAYEYEHTFPKTEDCGWGYPRFIESSKLLRSKYDVAPDGTLKVFCTFRIMDRPISSSINVQSATCTPSNGTPTLISNFKNLYFSSRHADLTMTVKDKEFRAHRSILSTRSSVFESMFLHDTVEKNSGIVEITDCDPDTFEDFLIFLYTGKSDNVSSSNAVSLYKSADKYDVKELKDECVRCMIGELSDDVFCDFLHLATMQNEKELLKAVTEYFNKNAITIVATTKWQTFLVEHPLLGNELFFKLLNSIYNAEK